MCVLGLAVIWLGASVEFLAAKHNGWRTRESQALGRGLWEDMVRLLSHVHLQLELCVVIPWIIVEYVSSSGRCWRRTSQAHSKPQWKRFCTSPNGKGVRVCVCLSIHPIMKMLVSSPAPHLMLSLLHRVIESHGQVRLGMVSCAEPCVSHMRKTFCGLLLKWSAVLVLWNKAYKIYTQLTNYSKYVSSCVYICIISCVCRMLRDLYYSV